MTSYIQIPQAALTSRDRPVEVFVEQQHELSRGSAVLEGTRKIDR